MMLYTVDPEGSISIIDIPSLTVAGIQALTQTNVSKPFIYTIQRTGNRFSCFRRKKSKIYKHICSGS